MPKNTWGGYRPGSGRRPKSGISGVSHHAREAISHRYPVQIVLATKPELGSLRKRRIHEAIRAGLALSCNSRDFRVCHYSVQKHGLRLIVEARDRMVLSRGMQGISVRLAKSLNRLWERNGSVFADRYAARSLETPEEVRASLCFVLNGARGDPESARSLAGALDPFSSAAYFDGWSVPAHVPEPLSEHMPIARPQTALLKSGWRKAGLLGVDETPS